LGFFARPKKSHPHTHTEIKNKHILQVGSIDRFKNHLDGSHLDGYLMKKTCMYEGGALL
jgi:hypothetical protein